MTTRKSTVAFRPSRTVAFWASSSVGIICRSDAALWPFSVTLNAPSVLAPASHRTMTSQQQQHQPPSTIFPAFRGPDHPWGWWSSSLRARATIGARTARYNENFPPLWAPKCLFQMFYERPAVASKPQGPRGPWSGPARSYDACVASDRAFSIGLYATVSDFGAVIVS